MKMSLMKNTKLLLASMMVLGLAGSSCDSSSGGGGGGGGVIIDPIVYVWYDVYGNGCSTASPRPGCNYYWYDSQTLVKIMDFEDPYFTEAYYNLTFGYKEFYLNGVLYYYEGWTWQSPTGIIYDEYGNALNKKKGRSRDMVGDVAQKEQQIVEKVGREFAAKHSLSAEKGIQIARALNQWATLGKDRQRTEADVAAFTERLYGVDYNKVKSAIELAAKGEKELLNETVSEAAKNWGISPENMKGMLKKWYKNVPGLE